MCPRSMGCKVILWFVIAALLGIAVSIGWNFASIELEYNDSASNKWILIGGVTSNSADFRIRLANDKGFPLKLEDNGGNDAKLVIAQDEALMLVFGEYSLLNQFGTDDTHPSSNPDYGIIALTVDNLAPQRLYYYGILMDDNSNNIELAGKFQTPAEPGTAFNFSIAAAACAQTGSTQHVFDVIREDHPSILFFLHLGDFHYEDIDSNDMTERLDAVSSVLNSDQQAELFRSVPLVYTWDDHDYVGDEVEGSFPPTDEIRDTARLSYQMAFPHYPLAAAAAAGASNATTSNNDNNEGMTPLPIYHAFTTGTVRFIMLDLQSDKSATSIYGAEQREWLFGELQQASDYDFVVLASSKPWIGVQSGDNEVDVKGSWIDDNYVDERTALSNLINEAIGGTDGPQNLLVLSGDAHMMAFDAGTNTFYGDNYTAGTISSFPILSSAPLDRLGSSKGGPFSEGCWSNDHERTHQYSILFFEFPPDGGEACIEIESFEVDQWFFKETIFEQRLCGKIFAPAKPPTTKSETCEIKLVTDITAALYIVTIIVSVVLAFSSCLVIYCEPGSQQSGCTRFWLGIFTMILVWFAGAAILALSIIIPVVNGIEQYDLRSSFLVALATKLLMAIMLFIIFFCCRSPKKPMVKPDDTDLNNNDVEISNVTPSILRPSVVRLASNTTVDDDHLPEGVILTGGEKLHAEGLNGKGVKVAVIDSGVDKDHPGFRGQVTKQEWLRSGTPLIEDDHGTHVAGTVHLMAPQAEIYDYRVFGAEGELGVDAAVAKAIRDATNAGCQVINMSLGGPFPNDGIWDAVQYASSKGVVMVCAAGNEGDNNPLTNEISFPASYKECISVAAVSKKGGFPVAVFSNSNPLIDCAGIGVDVHSFQPGGGYQKMSGTSMACPHVAGLVACLMTKGQTVADKIRDRLTELAIDIDVEGIDNATGVGFVTYLDKAAFNELMPTKNAGASPMYNAVVN